MGRGQLEGHWLSCALTTCTPHRPLPPPTVVNPTASPDPVQAAVAANVNVTLSATVNCSATPCNQTWRVACFDGQNATASGVPAAVSVGPSGAINTAALTAAITCTSTITVVDARGLNATATTAFTVL
jgi:hypothetical protein